MKFGISNLGFLKGYFVRFFFSACVTPPKTTNDIFDMLTENIYIIFENIIYKFWRNWLRSKHMN